MLFETKERTRTTPMAPGENEYQFYDSAAQPEYQVYRDLLNAWIVEFPEEHRAEMIARFKETDSLKYQAALAELTVHAALKRKGFTVEVHPPCPHPTRLADFLAKDAEGRPVAYIEVTSFGPAQTHVAQSNREAAIYNAIDKVTLPDGFRLGYDVQKYGESSPSTTKLCREIEAWAKEVQQDDPKIVISKVFDANDWKIELDLIGGFDKETVPDRAIGISMGDVRFVDAATEIREALEKKGDRYGVFEVPYVVAVVDCKDELAGADHNASAVIDAAFGSVVTQGQKLANGEIKLQDVRQNDGYFGQRSTPRHRNVSAALLLPKPHLWHLRDDRWQPLLLKNPWAAHPLPADFISLPGYEYKADTNTFSFVDGTRLADILGLPALWPPC